MNDIILEVKDLTKIFKSGEEDLKVLDRLNLQLFEKNKLIITGESGCGKSTFLNMVAGLDKPTEGEIIAGQWNVTSMGERALSFYRKEYIGLVFQFHNLLDEFTALENVMLPSYMTGQSRKNAVKRAEYLLELVNLKERMHHFPSQMSGGERQRAAVARALINNPELLLADEPTGNLDERNSAIVEEVLFDIVEKEGKTLILVTHDRELSKKGDIHLEIEKGTMVRV